MPVALITGAAKNIGRAIAIKLAEHGWDVGINYRSSKNAAAEVVNAIQKLGRQAWALQADITIPEQVDTMIKDLHNKADQIDLLVLNAGPYIEVPIGDTSLAQWQQIIDGNLNGGFYCCHAILPIMRKHGSGQIIAITAPMTHQVRASKDASAYYIAKVGLTALMKAIAVQEAKHGIRANCVAPGVIETENYNAERLKYLQSRIPLHAIGLMDDIANTVSYLASDNAKYINGAIIGVDGGFGE